MQNEKPPLVSIVIPCFNQAHFLKDAVESILAQTYERWECVIVDDGSPDNASAVAQEIIYRNPVRRISLIKKENGGLFDARNAGVRASNGELVLFLDADDKIHPCFLQETVPILVKELRIGFVYTAVQHFGARTDVWSGGPFSPQRFLRENQTTCTALFLRRMFDEVGGLKSEMKEGFEDWEFWISGYERGWFGHYVDKPYFYYRKHTQSSMIDDIYQDQSKINYLKAKIISMHQGLYRPDEIEWASRILDEGNPCTARSVGALVLRSRSPIASARREMKGLGVDLLEPEKQREFRSVGWISEIGDVVKSWDVLRSIRFIRDRLPANAPVLDIGSYKSELLPALHLLDYTSLTGIDLNPMLKQMPYADKIQYRIGNFMETPFPDASFSAITAISVIEHGFEGARLLRELSRLLRPGGFFIASVDYWPDKIETEGLAAFGMDWKIFSRQEILDFISQAASYDLYPVGNIDLDAADRVIDWNDRSYTFAWMAFRKAEEKHEEIDLVLPAHQPIRRVIIAHTDFRFSPTGANSGAETATVYLASCLAAKGLEVSVFGLFDSGSIHYRGVDFRSFENYADLCTALSSLSEHVDLFFGNSVQALSHAAKNPNIAFRAIWMHAPPDSYGASIPVINRQADAVVHVSRFQAEAARKVGIVPPVVLLHNGFSEEVFYPSGQHDPHTVVYAGAIVPHKGVHLLIQAFPAIRSAIPEAKLIICGSAAMWGEKPYFDAEIVARTYPGIFFTGTVTQKDLSRFFGQSGLGVIPTIKQMWQDPFPLTPVEMQACGLPVLVSNAGGLPESIREGLTGFVLDSDRPEEWAAKIIEILKDQSRLESMRSACVAHAKKSFRWQDLIEVFLNDVESLRKSATVEDLHESPTEFSMTPAGKEKGRIAFLTTYNQACGIATHAGFIYHELAQVLTDYPDFHGLPLVFAENTPLKLAPDEAHVFRCWNRENENFTLVKSLISREKVSILHVEFQDGLFGKTGILELVRYCRNSGVAVFITFHSSENRLDLCAELINESCRSFVHLEQSKVRFVAAGARPELIKIVPHGAMHVNPAPTKIAEAKKRSNISAEVRVVSSFGFFEQHKGVLEVIKAFPEVLKRQNAIFLFLGGPHPNNAASLEYLSQCRNAAQHLGIQDRVIMSGSFLPEPLVSQYLSASDTVILNYTLNRNEASGAAHFALAHRRPLITTSAPPFRPLAGCTFQLSDSIGIASAIVHLLNNGRLCEYLVSKAEEYIEDNSFRALSEILLGEYKKSGPAPTGISYSNRPRHAVGDRSSPVIGIDGRTFEYEDSVSRGIGHYTLHHTLELACQKPSWQFILFGQAEAPPSSIAKLLQLQNVQWKPIREYVRDIVDIFHIPDPMNFSPGFASPFEHFKAKKVSVTFHDLIPLTYYWDIWNEPAKREYLGRLAAIRQLADVVLANSENTRSDLLNRTGIQSERVSAVMAGLNHYPGEENLDPNQISQLKVRLGISKPFFLHVGALDPHKNFESVVNSFLRCRQQHPAQLVVVGQMAHVLKHYAEHIAQRGIQDIIFTGFIPRNELNALYREAISLLFLSKHEGFGFPVLEAMANECPVIASNATSIPEVAGEAALLFSPTDTEKVAGAMAELICNPLARDDLRKKGRKRALSFSWVKTASRTIDAWEKLLEVGSVKKSTSTQPQALALSNPVRRIPIAMPVYNRPDYLKQVLSALRECENIERFMIVTSEEPGFEEVASLIKSIDFIPVMRHTHEERWGCNRNVAAAINHAFEISDRAIILEDDIVPAKDFLNFMLWGLEEFESNSHVISICAYFRSLDAPDARKLKLTHAQHWFTPWGWATWRDRWSRFYRQHKDNLIQEQHSWDHFFNKGFFLADPENLEIRPMIGRVQNIGEIGTYVPSKEWQRDNQRSPYWHGNCEFPTISAKDFLLPEQSEVVLKDVAKTKTCQPTCDAGALVAAPDMRPTTPPSLIWQAPIFDPSGYADEARHLIQEVVRHRPVRVQPLCRTSERFAAGMNAEERDRLTSLMHTPISDSYISLVHAPAYAFRRDSRAVRNIGRTVFETDRIPSEWVKCCNAMDEVWVPTEFNVETFRGAGVGVPIVVVPEGVDDRFFRPGVTPLTIPGRRGFAFLSIFEWTYRKGWDVLLRAWAEAFRPEDDVCLILRTYPINATDVEVKAEIEQRIAQYLERELHLSIKDIAPIIVLGEQVPQRDIPALYTAADAFVLPSRGEGWGRPYIEAMACGLPVIGTRWGGNVAFMNDENSYLLDNNGLVDVDNRMEFSFYHGHRWADPSARHLVELMRRVLQHRSEAVARGLLARRDVVEKWTWEVAGGVALSRLNAIDADLQKRASVKSTVEVPPFAVRWEGSQFVHHSLALVNRELCLQLIDAGYDISIIPYEPHQFECEADSRFALLESRFGKYLTKQPVIHVRHQWPPNFDPPPDGHWVIIQPWEFGRLPEAWVEPMSTLVDEIWVPSRHVQKTYISSGIPADRVQVVPNGVNTQVFHPGLAPHSLRTDKSFKFLFVGGTIWRKGIDLLLQAYASSFEAADDVVLVIKDIGQDSFYRSQGAGESIRKLQSDPKAPEILYLSEMLNEHQMPGLFAACDCLVHPYRGEGFGLPIIEAMACGLPVLMTEGGAADDFCPPELCFGIPASRREINVQGTQVVGGVGWVLEPDLEELKRLLRYVYENREEAAENAKLAVEHVRANYTWEKVAQRAIQRMGAIAARPIRREQSLRSMISGQRSSR